MIATYGKRCLSFLMALVMVFSLIPVQAFATEIEADHDHDHTEGTEHVHEYVAGEVVAPTCGRLGYTPYTCECGATENRDTVAATGEHNYVTTTYEPTATEQGYTEHICAGCGDSYRDTYVDPIGEEEEEVEETEPETEPEEDEIPESWTEEMLEIQALIDEYIDYYLVYYGFEIPDLEYKPEEEMTSEELAQWEEVYAQIEDIVANKMDDNERDNALFAVKEVGYYLEEELTKEQAIAILEVNPVFELFDEVVAFYAYGGPMLLVPDSYGLDVENITATYGTATNSATGSWTATANSVTRTLLGKHSESFKFDTYDATSVNLTLTNTASAPVNLSFSYTATITNNKGSVTVTYPDGTMDTAASGNVSKELAAGEAVVVTFSATKGGPNLSAADAQNGGTLTLSSISAPVVVSNPKITINYDSALGGVTVNGAAVSSGTTTEVEKDAEVTLVATPAENAVFLGWMDETNAIKVTASTYTFAANANVVLTPVFAQDGGTPWFGVGSTVSETTYEGALGQGTKFNYQKVNVASLYNDLNTAMENTASGQAVVLMNNATLPAGDYTIPAGKTLLVPFDAENTLYTTTPVCTTGHSTPVTYRKLTLAEGVNIVVNGAISVPAPQVAGGNIAGAPKVSTGMIEMKPGSSITVKSGGNLYVWGYITGTGFAKGTAAVIVESGGTVYEDFQVMNWRGGSAGTGMISDNSKRVFPLSQYYVQNVEVPMKLVNGAAIKGYISVNVLSITQGTPIDFVGSSGMFNIKSGYVIKDYDEATDRLILDANGAEIAMQKIKASLAGYSIDSSSYDLPINGNITMNINAGSKCTLEESIALLPGAQLNIAAGAECTLGENKNIYIYDASDWGNYSYQDGTWYTGQTGKVCPVVYAPGRTGPMFNMDSDAKVTISGMVDASLGYVYETKSGAGVYGTDGAIVYGRAGTENATTYQATQADTNITYVSIPTKSVLLRNGDGTTVNSADYPNATYFEYVGSGTEGKWVVSCGQTHDFSANTPSTVKVEGSEPDCLNPVQVYVLCGNSGCTIYTTEKTVASNSAEAGYAALGHKNADGTTAISHVPAAANDCDNAGNIEHFKCALCGGLFADVDGNTPLSAEDVVIAAKGHNYQSAVTTPASCTAEGVRTYTCNNNNGGAVCGHSYTEAIEKLDHTYVSKVTEPTCTEQGYTTYTCSACPATYEDNYVDAKGHNYEVIPGKADECKEGVTGYKESYRCKTAGCGLYFSAMSEEARIGEKTEWDAWILDSEGGLVDDVQHTPGAEATCTTAQSCTTCQAVIVAAKGHTPGAPEQKNFDKDTGIYDQVIYCTECNAEISRKTIVPGMEVNHTGLVQLPMVPATCTETGLGAGVACEDPACTACQGKYVSDRAVLPALGHDLGGVEIEYKWDYENLTCTASGLCQRNCGVTVEETVTVNKNEIKATCEAAGSITYTAKFQNAAFGTKTETKAGEAKLEHVWGEIEYKWDYENLTCTATQKCSHESTDGCTRTEVIAGVTSVETAATCEANAYTTYTAKFSQTWHTNKQQTSVVYKENTAIGHKWTVEGTLVWDVADEAAMTCTANLVCENDYNHTEKSVQTTNVEKSVVDATCDTAGSITYTATFAAEWGIKTQTKTETIKALNHNWEYSYAWSDDNTSCTATRTCKNDVAHTETETVVATAKAGTATCTQAGKITYTTAAFTNFAFAVQTKQVEQEALGHNMAEHNYKAPTCQNPGNKLYYTCDRCNGVYADSEGKTGTTVAAQTLGKVEHSYTVYVSDNNAECEKDGTETAKCDYYEDGCALTHTRAIAGSALDHDYEGVVTEHPTCTEKGTRTYTCQNDATHTYTEDVDALGHVYAKVTGKAATCEEAGWNDYYQCTGSDERSYCGAYFAAESDTTTIDLDSWKTGAGAIAALNHIDADTDHTCDRDGCTEPMGEHVDTDPKDHKCDYGCKVEDFADHADVTTDEDHLCDYCGDTIGGHEYVNGSCNCGDIQILNVYITIKAEGSKDVELDPETTKYGEKFTKTLDLSSFGNCFSIDSVTVTMNGQNVDSLFNDNEVRINPNIVTDDITIVVKAVQRHNSDITGLAGFVLPTCTEPGKTLTAVTCSKCNTKWNTLETIIPALGHDYNWDGGKVYTAPTFDAEGYYTHTCQRCHYTYTKIEGDKLIAVAKIGETRFESLEEAIAAAVSGNTIELLMATAVEGTQTWDLEGVTLKTAAADGSYGLTVRGDLTVNGGNFQVAGTYGIGISATGKLTVNGGEFVVAGDSDYLIGSYGTVIINGGTFVGQYNCVNGFAGTVSISGGTFTTADTDCTGEYASEDVLGYVAVTGGSFSKTAEAYLADGYCQKLNDSYYVVGQHLAGEAQEENKINADCINNGSYELAEYCTHCGAEMSRESFVITAPGHNYNWDGGKVVTAPTCTEKGYTTYICSVCDETHTDDEVAAKGHLMTEIPATPATCETDGNNAYFTCSRCSGVFKDENGEVTTTAAAEFLTRTGHNYDSGVIKEGDEPTCTEKGTKTFTCQNDASHTYTEDVAALEHDYSQDGCKIVTPPTCTEEGYTTYSCARCDHEEVKDKVSATGHKGKWVKGQAATCLDAGWIAYYQCENTCGLFYEDMACTKLIGDADALAAWKTSAGATAADGHNYTTVTGQKPDCVDAGYLEYHKCSRCKLYFSEKKNESVIGDGSEAALVTWKSEGGDGYLKALGHTEGEIKIENVKAPGCTADGSHDEVIYCVVCTDKISSNTVVDAATGHTEQIIPAKAPDCVNTGLSEGIKCSVCNTTLKAQEKVNALGHTEVIDPAVAATCTAAGKTEGVHCSVCNVVLTAQAEVPMLSHNLSIKSVTPAKCTVAGKQILECTYDGCTYEISEDLPATGHTDVIDAAVDATCSKTGLTEGKHCSVCGATIVKQEVVPTIAHTEVIDAAVDATCTKTGLTEGKHCSVCNQVLEKQNTVAALGHKEVVDAAVDATCTETGLTEGKHCSVCNEILVAQKEVAVKGHTEVIDAAVDATCTETGLTEGKHCSVCNETLVKQEVVKEKGHAEVVDPAVAAACEIAGKTEGKHCSRCNEVLVAQEEIPALEHKMSEATCAAPSTCENGCGKIEGEALPHTPVDVEELPAMCEEPGHTAGQICDVCGATIEGMLVIPASGHSIVQMPAKKPTFGNPGWEAYERCLNCNYTTMVEIPALPVPSVKTYEQFIKSLIQLEELTAEYIQLNPGKDPLGLMIEYIRTGVDRYNSGSWNIMAGYEDPDYAKFISQREDEINSQIDNIDDMIKPTALKDIHEFFLPNGDGVDFGHMFGTMDITYHNNFSENHADVAGWAGDLVDLLSTADRHNVYAKDENGNYPTIEEMVKEIGEKYLMHDIAGEDDQFGHSDMYGDLDGFYLMDTLKKQGYELGDLAKLMQAYFTEDLTAEYRAEYFLKNRLDGVSTRNAIRDAAYSEYVSNKVISTLEGTRDFATDDISQMRIACCYAFADYLCKLGGDYVEVPGNDYYTVFESEFSTLAPGITQEIKKATTADNKQIVYYIATADLNRSDVNVYANYNENDPTKGWKMSRVLDQAQAAQNRYGDPDSAEYIENYNVITSINADGFNMSTGEPGGVLVMLGTEYHPINSSGFFGILKNGKAVIGTMADYNAMKDQIAEAVGGFGTMLVKDGKVAISRTDNYYSDRASRTAVGITRSGKVIFMVLDGRQEPVSCGGSMQEIAQIMLEAGCYEAINLDGGGSTTYVAKPEGENELRVVSKPSDGFARSVSTSLMMVSTAPSSTAFDHAMVESDYDYLTPGSTINVTAKGVSATGNEAELPEGAFWSVESDKATISEDGVLTALGLGTVNVNLMVGDKVIGSKMIQIVNPDAIYFTRETLNAVYGSATELPIKALYLGKPIAINTGDVKFTLGNEAAGSISGFAFTAKEDSGVKVVKITAALTADNTKTASISVSMFNQGEMSFDFDKATGGDRVMAWDRQVSNATTDDQSIYEVVKLGEPMVTTYTFALDMSQISMPEQIADLTYMLPGADAADASAWNFLLQLAERVSVLTEVTAKVSFDKNFDVDYSQMKIVCEYFVMNDPAKGIVYNEEENTLTLTLNWKDQTQAIDPETADPLVLLSGIKLTPKADAAWDAKDRLIPVHSGEISYHVFLRANALYTFASKEANQLEYGLMPFENKDVIIGGATEKGGSFKNVYVTFEDTYTLINAVKNGWVGAEGGYMYYIDGVYHTGIQEVDGFWYDFGENGICIGQQKYNGLFVKNGKTYYARFGVLVKDDWMSVGGDRYRFDKDGAGLHGTVVIDEVELKFDNGKMIGGYSGFIKKSNGKTYHYDNGAMTLGWYLEDGDWYHFDTGTGVMNTGTHVLPDAEAKSKNAYYDFASDGKLISGYFNPAGYYYWPGLITGSEHAGTGLPKIDQWVQSGAVADDWPANGATKDSWYRTNSHGHFVTGGNSSQVFKYEVDGVTHNAIVIAINGREYTFDNDHGYLLRGFFSYEKDNWFYYWLDEPVNDGWFDVDGETYYAYGDGHLAIGSHVIDGKSYMFNTKGQLIKDGIRMYVTFNNDNTVMTVSTSETKNLTGISIAIWSDASNQADMIWFEAEVNAKGEWTATVPLCLYEKTGNYQFHAYATNNSGETALLVNTTSNVAAVAKHIAGEAFEANRTTPTCTVDGGYDMVVACTRCETELSKEHHVIPAAHTPGEPVAENVKEAACVNGGSYDKVVYCSVCNAELSRVEVQIPAGTHEAGTAVKENEIAATCTTDGGYDLVEYCVSCRTELSRKHVVLKATGHQKAEPVVEKEVAATCTTDGGYDTVVYCAVCEEEISREHTVLKATGHKPGDEVVENKFDVTCLADGSYELVTYCTVCEEELSREKVEVPAVGHQYTDSKDDTCNVCGESRSEVIETTPMYRLYNPNSGEHFYTGSVEERDMLVDAGWNYEGVAWNAPVKTGEPVYRLFNPNNADHHYTMSIEERDWLVSLGWNYEGVAWNSASPSNLPQYRMYNPNAVTGSHHYTGSVEEREMLVEAGWIYEGIGWFGMLK